MKEHLERYLQQSREGLVASLDGLSDDDVRRPMTASGTNLLGVVKHVATTFGHLLVRVVDETARHAGHCDIVRELIDGRGGRSDDLGDSIWWDAYVAGIQAAADTHRTP